VKPSGSKTRSGAAKPSKTPTYADIVKEQNQEDLQLAAQQAKQDAEMDRIQAEQQKQLDAVQLQEAQALQQQGKRDLSWEEMMDELD
jgi:hypothetical protein